jgi:hypothetical protein
MPSLSILLTLLLPLAFAQDKKHSAPANSLRKTPTATLRARALPGLSPRQIDSCTGSCVSCFGSGYLECPDSDYWCYLPGDSLYGLDTCPSSSGSTTDTEPAYPTTTGSAGDSDTCYGTFATCVSCFGPGYLDCGNGEDCYNPDGERSFILREPCSADVK